VSRATAARRHAAPAEPAVLPGQVGVEPVNKLSDAERAHVLEVLNSPRFVDQAPLQIYAQLLDEGVYLCSVSTMYRVLRENTQVRDRRRQATHPPRTVPELVATAPRQVYSWDITKLAGPVRGQYFDCYVMIDIYSRYIVGAHADRGTSMTSKTVATLLADLEVTRSHSRPRVSNDNPYSEAWFKTLKYAPVFPERFSSLQAAREFMSEFVDFYNHDHRHLGIGLHTPGDVHYGHAADAQQRRAQTLAAARNQHPTRFTTTTTPKILNLPEASWINQPAAPTSAA
jgi:hypothetical protein